MNQTKFRKNFKLRLQPTIGTPLYEVVEWLNSQDTYHKNQLIKFALIAYFLPSARYEKGESDTQLALTVLNSISMTDKHFATFRQMLNLPSQLSIDELVKLEGVLTEKSGSNKVSKFSQAKLEENYQAKKNLSSPEKTAERFEALSDLFGD